MRVVLFLGVVALVAGCGAQRVTTTTVVENHAARPATTTNASELHVGVVGSVPVPVPGVHVERGTLDAVVDADIVFVADQAAVPRLAAVAAAHPLTQFVLGGAAADHPGANVQGIVLRDDEAALLAGVVAGAAAQDEASQSPSVGWAGPEERPLLSAFARGAHEVDAQVQVLHAWSQSVPAACKEAALSLVAAGAIVVAAHSGLCAEAVAAGAHEQDVPALRLSDFEFPGVAVAATIRDLQAGITHGGENVVYGFASGAIAVGAVDPRIATSTLIRARTIAAGLVSGSGG